MWKILNVFSNLCLIILLLLGCQANMLAQDYKFINRTVPSSYLKVKSAVPKVNLANFVSAEKYLPRGYSKKGTVDYTSYIQKAVTDNRNVIMPNFPILVNATGIKIGSNSKVYFQEKSQLILAPTNKDIYHVILIKNSSNVTLYNVNIRGDRKRHLGKGGEWGMGISIYNSENIQLYNPYVVECWGDGIYLGREKGAMNNKNIKIYSAQLHQNRRNGISVISALGLLLQNPVVSNTNGTLPMSGIVMEPNNNSDEINNITINNARTFNNRYGILVYLKAMQGPSKKDVNIEINSPIDNYSLSGAAVSDVEIKGSSKKIGGKISINNPIWQNNQKSFSKHKNGKLPMVNVVGSNG